MANQDASADGSQFAVGDEYDDALFDVLSDSRRRFTLLYLEEAETPLSVAELTTELQAWEADNCPDGQRGPDRDTVEISLVHSHLPKMDERRVVDYDPARRTVSLAEHADAAQSYL